MKKYQFIVRIMMAVVVMFGVQTTVNAQIGSLVKKAKSVADKAKDAKEAIDAKKSNEPKETPSQVQSSQAESQSDNYGSNEGSKSSSSNSNLGGYKTKFDVDLSKARHSDWDYTSGGGNNGGSTSGDSWAHLINETAHEVQINGNTMTYGTHVYTLNGQINLNETNFQTPTAYVTFTNVPSGYTEFEAVYSNFLGKSLHGTAAMIPMAFEIYARDAALGERCLNLLCNSTSTVSGIVRQLKNKFNYSAYSPENDLYVQRFLPAATLKGAAFNNGYNPTEPYTVEMVRSANAPQETTITGYGTNYYLYILAPGGWDSFQRGVEVWQAMGSDMYKVYNCPSTYTQCKNIIGTWNGLK